jgi:hypothetical protein
MSSMDRLIDPKATKDFTSIAQILGSEIVCPVPVDYRIIAQRISTRSNMVEALVLLTVSISFKSGKSDW